MICPHPPPGLLVVGHETPRRTAALGVAGTGVVADGGPGLKC